MADGSRLHPLPPSVAHGVGGGGSGVVPHGTAVTPLPAWLSPTPPPPTGLSSVPTLPPLPALVITPPPPTLWWLAGFLVGLVALALGLVTGYLWQPSVEVTPSYPPPPAPTPSSVDPSVTVSPEVGTVVLKDTFAQGGTETVTIDNPAHVPEVGTWRIATINTPVPVVAPSTGYCVRNPSGTSTAAATLTGYQPLLQTVYVDMHQTFLSGVEAQIWVQIVGTNVLFRMLLYYSGSALTVYGYDYFLGQPRILGQYTWPAPLVDVEFAVTWQVTPQGVMSVFYENAEILTVSSTMAISTFANFWLYVQGNTTTPRVNAITVTLV